MTRPGGRQAGPQKTQQNDGPKLNLQPSSTLYPFCSRLRQTPVRSMLMSHGCCFDFFEKGFCRAGNDCKYSHLKPGDERTLIMDSEFGLRRKKYYRPETLATYRPGSQDVICFTYARKGWCVHGDKCWNQHINPPAEIFQDALTSLNGMQISKTPSPIESDLPTPVDETGYAYPYGPRESTPPVVLQNQPWSAATLVPAAAIGSEKANNEHLRVAASKGNCKLFCQPDPKRTASSNWRIPSKSKIPDQFETVVQQEPVRSALNFNWRPVIDDACDYKWHKGGQHPGQVMAQVQPATHDDDLELLIDFSEDEYHHHDAHKYMFANNTHTPGYLH